MCKNIATKYGMHIFKFRIILIANIMKNSFVKLIIMHRNEEEIDVFNFKVSV